MRTGQGAAPSPDLATLAPEPELREAWLADGESYAELLWRTQIRIERSGWVESRVEQVRHFLTESGVQQAGNLQLGADAARDRLTIESAYATVPPAPPVSVSPSTIQVIDDPRIDVFSDWRQVIVPYAGLSPGSNAVLVFARRFQSEGPLPWSRLILMATQAPVARVEISVEREPGAMPIAWASDDPDLRCEELSPRKLFCQRDRVPAVRQDPDVSSYLDVIDHLYVGEEGTWEGLRDRVGDLVYGRTQADAALRRQVASLLEGASDPTERFRRLYRFVADDVRYVALSHGDWAVVPRPASVTLRRRFGDCKDKVTLLVAMAQLADLRVWPVLTNSARYRKERLLRPGSDYFDHMIACAALGGTAPVCVDPTVAHAKMELPAHLGGAVALDLRPEESAEVFLLPQGDFGWELASRREVLLGCDGGVGERSRRSFSGPASFQMRLQLLALRARDRERWALEEYRSAVSSDLRPSFEIVGLDGSEELLEIRFETESKDQFDPAAGLYVNFDPWLVSYMRSMVSLNRNHPHRMVGLRYVAEDTYRVCDHGVEAAGAGLEIESRFGSVTRRLQRRGGSVVSSTTVELPAIEIPVDDLEAFERFVENVLRDASVWLAWSPDGER